MDTIQIKSLIRDFPVFFSQDFSFIESLLNEQHYRIIVGKKVYKLYKKKIFNQFPAENIIVCNFEEKNKTLKSVLNIYEQLLQIDVKKNLTLISFGGGVNQDVVGFVASTLYRGINWIYVPTTLLAMADSSIGLKTSLNFLSYKNIIGTFYPPTKVYICPLFLSTLDKKDYLSGMGEILKLLLMKEDSIAHMKEIVNKIQVLTEFRDNRAILKIIKEALTVKLSYMKDDEFDHGRRNLLNYGHEFGHALESTSSFLMPHGIAVMFGMIFANIVSLNRHLITKDIFKKITYELLIANLPLSVIDLKSDFFDSSKLLENLKKDKKRISTNLPLVLPNNNFHLIKVDDFTKKEFIKNLKQFKKIIKI